MVIFLPPRIVLWISFMVLLEGHWFPKTSPRDYLKAFLGYVFLMFKFAFLEDHFLAMTSQNIFRESPNVFLAILVDLPNNSQGLPKGLYEGHVWVAKMKGRVLFMFSWDLFSISNHFNISWVCFVLIFLLYIIDK